MMRAVFVVALLFLPSLASAGWFYVPNGSGYYYKTNGAVNDGWLYSKSYSCDSCGHRTYSWVKYQQIDGGGYSAPDQNYSGYASNAVQNSLVTLAKEKFEWQTIQQTINQLFPGAGQPGGYSAQYGYQQKGSTVYGPALDQQYSVQTVSATNSKPFDFDLATERLARMFAQASDAAKPLADGVVNATAQQIAGNNAALQTMAQSIREQALLQSIQPIQPQDTKVETQFHASASSSAGTGPAPQPNADPPLSAKATATAGEPDFWPALQGDITQNCGSCHAGGEAAKGVDLSGDIRQFSRDKWALVLKAVTNPDEAHRMPLGPNNTPGKPLSYESLGRIVKAWGAQ